MLGSAAVAMWWNVPPEARAEWEDWHTHEHMPERLAIPGFLRGTRWVARSGEPSYFVLYETTDLETLTGGAYLDRLNNPTAWSRKMMAYHRNMVRSLCRVRATFGGGLAQATATIRFSPPGGGAASMLKWLADVRLAVLPERKGLCAAHLLESLPADPKQLTEEQKIRGMDAQADCVVIISGYDVEALEAIVAVELGELESRGVPPGSIAALYRCAYSLTSRELST